MDEIVGRVYQMRTGPERGLWLWTMSALRPGPRITFRRVERRLAAATLDWLLRAAGKDFGQVRRGQHRSGDNVAKKSKFGFKDEIGGLPSNERLAHAHQSIEGVNNIAHFLLPPHETNQIVVYSNLLSSQVGRSYAANAYNNFTRALQETESVNRLPSMRYGTCPAGFATPQRPAACIPRTPTLNFR